MQQVNSVFAYGTLKRGQIRESMWPCNPLRVFEATIRANLHDLGAYPAITDGPGQVGGEIWEFHDHDMHQVLRVLDQIEWYQQDGNDLYIRRIVECQVLTDELVTRAYTYFYANKRELTAVNQIAGEVAVWPTGR